MTKDMTLETTKLYIDGAKTFVQLSSAGLVLPIVLKSNVIGFFGRSDHSSSFELFVVCISWICFLVAIGAGVLYQYVAVKFIEYQSDPGGTYVPPVLGKLITFPGPGLAYGTMVVAFYAGAVSVVIYSLAALFT